MNENNDIMKDVLLDVIKSQRKTIKSNSRLFLITIICYTVILISMVFGFFWYESQFEVEESVTTTITQEVDGEDSEINNVSGDMYKDNSTHNE